MTKRDFYGEEWFKWALQDYEALRQFRNEVSGRRPTELEKILLRINKPWEAFYKAVLTTPTTR